MQRNEVITFISRIAREQNEEPECWLQIARVESGFRPLAYNAQSGARGLYQIVRSIHRNVSDAEAFDAEFSTRWAIAFARSNRAYLRSVGVPVTCFTTYLAHQQGAGGANVLWKAAQRGNTLAMLPEPQRTNVLNNMPPNVPRSTALPVAEWLRAWEQELTNTVITTTDLPRTGKVVAGVWLNRAELITLATLGVAAAITVGISYLQQHNELR